MVALFYRVAVVSAAVSVVLLPLLLAPRWQKRYAPHTRRAVWLVIAAVLLAAPLLPKSQAPVQIAVPERTVTLPVAVPVALQNGTVPVRPITPEAAVPEMPVQSVEEAATARTMEWGVLLTALWLTGGAAVLLWQGMAYLRARRRVMKHAAPLEGYEELAAKLCPRRSVRFFRVNGLRTPMTLGVFRPMVLLPQGEVRQAAVCHELIHVRRRDVDWKVLLLLACAVHWFNPLVWLMSRRADRDMEASCDSLVVAGGDAAFRRAYGELLLETAAGRTIPLTTRFGGGKKLMKGRLYDLFHPGKKSRVLVGAVLLLCLLAGSLVACRQTPEDALQTFKDSVRYEDGVVSFTIPKNYSPVEDWNIHIAGRAETPSMGDMSLHYLDGEEWAAGKTYTLDITEEQWEDITELTMYVELKAKGVLFDLLAMAGRSSQGDSAGYELHQVVLPSSEREKNSNNAEIFEIDPFAVNLCLPAGWTVREAASMSQEGKETYPAVDGIFSIQCILDETGRPVGSLGYNLAPTYEYETDDPMALFAGITMAKYRFDVWETYDPVVEAGGLTVALTDVVQEYSHPEGIETTSNRGFLLRDEGIGVYVAVELESGALTDEQTLAIAGQLSLSAVKLADGVYCASMPGFVETDGEPEVERWKFTLAEYDPETGARGQALGTYALPLAEKLTLQRLREEAPSDAGEVGSDERGRRVAGFMMWPLLRSSFDPGLTDLMEVQVRSGAVTSLKWFQVPAADALEEDAGEVQAPLDFDPQDPTTWPTDDPDFDVFDPTIWPEGGGNASGYELRIHPITGEAGWYPPAEDEDAWREITSG